MERGKSCRNEKALLMKIVLLIKEPVIVRFFDHFYESRHDFQVNGRNCLFPFICALRNEILEQNDDTRAAIYIILVT